jgi:hypothetical protein
LQLVCVNYFSFNQLYVGATYQHALSDVFANGNTTKFKSQCLYISWKEAFLPSASQFWPWNKNQFNTNYLTTYWETKKVEESLTKKKIVSQNPNVIFNVFCFLLKSKRHG